MGGWDWLCSVCESTNPGGTRFCGSCGGPARPDHLASLWACLTCGASNAAAGGYCGHCGTERTAEPRYDDERRMVTALFADISGFTTLAERLEDAEALHTVIEPVIAGLAKVAERYSGFIAKYAGDALLVFFGAPVAHEDDPARALLVALEMHAALPALLDALPVEGQGLEMHIGVNTGRVVSGQFGGDQRSDYSILGEAVIVAQRLESVAPPGATYVGATTVELAGDGFRFEEVGELQLKGKVKTVQAWRLLDRRIVATATTGQLGPLVGRLAEVESIETMLSGLAGGRGGVIGVLGEPGVGKSRLIAEARLRAGDRRTRWLQTRCLAYGEALPYWPFAELVRSVAGISPAEDDRDARDKLAAAPGVAEGPLPYLARLVGARVEPGELPADSEEVRAGLHQALGDWLVALGREVPTVLSIEDIHWMDKASRSLTRQLARIVDRGPVALVLSARLEGAASLAEITGDLDPSSSATFALGPLEPDDLVDYLSYLLGGEPPPELIQVIDVRAHGNPLFVDQVTRSLIDSGALGKVNDRWRVRPGWAAGEVPDTIERVLAGRIDLLPTEQASLLRTASAIGRLVRVPLLRAVVDDDRLDERLDGLVMAGLLDPSLDGAEPGFVFHHALVQDVAYDRLLRKDRQDLHRRIAEVAVSLYGDGDDVVDLLARHAFLGQLPEAASILGRAARRAQLLFANDEALVHLGQALEVAEPEAQAGLHLQLGDLRNVVGDYVGALHHYTEADGPRAARGRADVLRKLGDPESALVAAEEALADLPESSPHRPALLLQQGWSLLQRGDAGPAGAVLRQAVVEAHADDPVMVTALGVLATASSEVEPADAVQFGLFAQRFAERRGDHHAVGAALRVVGGAYRDMGWLDEAVAALRAAIEVAQRTGEAQELGASLLNLGMAELVRGRLDEAIALDELAAAQFERIDHSTGVALAWGNMAEKLLEAGRADEAEHWCLAAIAKATAIDFAVSVADVTLTLASVRERQGRLVEAAELAAESAARFEALHESALAERAGQVVARLRVGAPS